MEYGKYFDKLILREPSFAEKIFIGILTKKAKEIGQDSHQIWTLKYLIDNFAKGNRLRVVDIGTHGGWVLSYNSPKIIEKIGIDYDDYFAEELRKKGIKFYKIDLEKDKLPLKSSTADIVTICSTLEHVANVEEVAAEIYRILNKNGIVYVIVPDVEKYKFKFWNDVTHKRPFTKESLRFLFESSDFETVRLGNYNHNLFIAGFLFPRFIHETISKFGEQLVYIGRKK